jgi:glucose/mannose-6-phosphate isomerase
MREDNSKMLAIIEKFPMELKTPFVSAQITKKQKPNKIIICGMGGSAIAGRVIKDILADDLNIHVVNDYILPKIKGKPLVIVCSYSGNTQETLSCFEQALKRKYDIVGIGSGGKLLQFCKENNIEWVKLKPGIPPRTAFPNLFASIFHVLELKGIVSGKKKEIEHFSKNLDLKAVKERAQVIAEGLGKNVPVIYTYDFPAVAKRIKDEFNENAKIHSRVELFPELNHNDVNSWLNCDMSARSKLIILRSNEEPEQISKVITITEKLLHDKTEILEFQMNGKNRLEKALNTILTFDLASVYLAEINKVDSFPVKIIEEFKEMLD